MTADARIRRHGAAARCNRPKLPGYPASTTSGPHLPHQPLGLRLHRRRLQRRPMTSWRTSGSASSAPAPPRAVRAALAAAARTVRVPAHPLVGRRPRQRADRPDWATALGPGGSSERMDNFTAVISGAIRRGRPGQGRLDRPDRPCWSAAARPRPASPPPEVLAAARARRLQKMSRSAPGSTRSSGPGDRRGAQAVVQPAVQATVLPRRVPAGLQPAQRHAGRHAAGGSSASPRRGVVVGGTRIPARLPDLRHGLRGRRLTTRRTIGFTDLRLAAARAWATSGS